MSDYERDGVHYAYSGELPDDVRDPTTETEAVAIGMAVRDDSAGRDDSRMASCRVCHRGPDLDGGYDEDGAAFECGDVVHCDRCYAFLVVDAIVVEETTEYRRGMPRGEPVSVDARATCRLLPLVWPSGSPYEVAEDMDD